MKHRRGDGYSRSRLAMGEGGFPFAVTLAAICTLTAGGTAGFMYIEDMGWIDSLYMTVITLSTVGFGEVQELSQAGRLFTVVLIVLGIGVVLTIIGAWARALLEGELQAYFGMRRTQRMLRDLKDHYIVCGYGRFGRRLVAELEQRGVSFVVIERDKPLPEGMLGINDDATREEVLEQAGVARARGLLTTFPSDADNLYVTLTGREMNPDLFIVARCENDANEARLKRAGATRTVSPYSIAGHRMAQAALHPRVLDFVDVLTSPSDRKVGMAEVAIAMGSLCDGVTLGDADLRSRFGVHVVAVASGGGDMEFNVSTDRLLEQGDTLLAIGDEKSIDLLASATGSEQ